MCEFGDVMREPRQTIDPVNHELALNWLRQRYNLLTAKELSESIFKESSDGSLLKLSRNVGNGLG